MDPHGRLEQVDGEWQVRFTRRLAHPPEKVWRALTEPEHLSTWFPTDIEGDREAGAKLRFVFREDEGPSFDGEMLTFDPPKVMELMWGTDRLRFELVPDEDGTVLTLIDAVDDLGKAARDAAGWHVCLDALEHDLRGERSPWEQTRRWKEVAPIYIERFGPEASTIGPPGS
jgi:uncharacterized protein YndB with AHSA1/START domain